MNRITRHGYKWAWLLFLASAGAQAMLDNGSASIMMGTQNISFSQGSMSTVRWRMQRFGAAGAPGETVSSAQGEFRSVDGSLLLGSNLRRLAITRSLTGSNDFEFVERVHIPQEVLFRAGRLNLRQIAYVRSFNDCPGPVCSTLTPSPYVVFTLAGGSGLALDIMGFSLRFEDNKTAAMLAQGEPLRARIRVDTTGSGTIRGIWEVATPSSTSGSPVFRSIQMVNQYTAGGDSVVLLSPVLPSEQSGTYLIRFRLLEPLIDGDEPELQYMVMPAIQETLNRLELSSPLERASIHSDTEFSWMPVPEAASYKLLLVDRQPDVKLENVVPVAGMLVRPEQLTSTITPSLFSRLEPGAQYWWTVLALDKGGQVVAAANWRNLSVGP